MTDSIYHFDLLNIERDRKAFDYTNILYGTKITLAIDNVNKDLYDVKIDTVKNIYNTDVPKTLSSISLPSALLLKNQNAKVVSNENEEPAKKAKINSVSVKTCDELINNQIKIEGEKITSEIQNFQIALTKVNNAIQFYNYLDVLKKECGLSYETIKDKEIDFASKCFNEKRETFLDPSEGATFIFTYTLDGINKVKKSFTEISTSLDKIDSFINYNDCNEIEEKKIRNFSEREKANLSSIKTTYDKIIDFEQNDETELIIQRYESINRSNYTVSSTLKANNADEVNFAVSITPKPWIPCSAIQSNFQIKLLVKKGLKIDFSTGIFGNFGNTRFNGNTYYIDSSNVIRQLNTYTHSLIPSIGALVHVYRRSGRSLSWGGAVGASITTDLKITNFHLGPTVMINTASGIIKRMAISGGITWRYVNELRNDLQVGQTVDKKLTIDQLESGIYRRGWFIAISYNLSSTSN